MAIDNSSSLNAIDTIKNKVQACFTKCTVKGSTFSGTKKLNNLETAIDLIPQSGGGGTTSENVTGQSFNLFRVTYSEDDPFDPSFTIDFGNVGVTWRSIHCYSDTNQGYFSIQKLPNQKCIISAVVFYDTASRWDEGYGIYPSGRGTHRASYEISGNSITFTLDEFEASSNDGDYDDYADTFRGLPNQVSDYVNDYFRNQYKLEKITICV